MSDERELPERVWIEAPWPDQDGGLWSSYGPHDENDVPYLRADKPVGYAICLDERCYLIRPSLSEEEAREIAQPGDTVHPVYIGPAIEPEEKSDG